jgi:hypothetical protein
MKINKICIGIKSLDASLREAGEIYEQAAKGKKIKAKTAVYFTNLKEMQRYKKKALDREMLVQ